MSDDTDKARFFNGHTRTHTPPSDSADPQIRRLEMELDHVLSDIGQDIAHDGIDRVPQVQALAAAVRSIAPVVAGVLSSDDEPAVARERAFLRAAILANSLPPSEQALLMGTFRAQTIGPRVVDFAVVPPVPSQLSPAPALASAG